mmetsp:Transcript_732/g.1938  ORF Transcript_732/g.1938 Transcript_732/m.1938 type:complete len:210 (+) Transcript_732:37-666(+)
MGWASPCFLICTWARRATTVNTFPWSPSTCSAWRRMSPRSSTGVPEGPRPPGPETDRVLISLLEPPSDHHCFIFCTSGSAASKMRSPPSSSEPLRPPFHSLTRTPFIATSGLPANVESSCFARSPQSVTIMLVAVSSAKVISRFTSSWPALDVNVNFGWKPTMTPQRSVVHGRVFDCTSRSPVILKMCVWICATSPTSSIWQALSKDSS